MDDEQHNKPLRGDVFPKALGPLSQIPWPTPAAPRYILTHGDHGTSPGPETWGVTTFEGNSVTDAQVWREPPLDGVKRTDLSAWLLKQKVAPEAVRDMVAASHPKLFVLSPS